MTLSHREFSSLLEALYAGVFEAQPWQCFLDDLRTRSGARYVSLTFRPIDQDEDREYHSGDLPAPEVREVFREKFVRDPLPHHGMTEGRVYDLDALLQPEDPLQRSFYAEIMVPHRLLHVLTIRVRESSGADAWLSVSGDREFAPELTELMAMLVPHFRTALQSFVALERERFRARLAHDAIHRMKFGWLTLDAGCRIVDIDAHAQQLLGHAEVLRRTRENRLVASRQSTDRQIAALVQSFAQHPEAARPSAINLSRDPWIDMLIAPIRAQPIPASPTPVAIAYLNGDRWSRADRCDQLVDLFGLLPSEARLAWALAQGMSLRDAALALGVTRETARSYAKQIYGKLGARGQADVVRIILTSVLAIA